MKTGLSAGLPTLYSSLADLFVHCRRGDDPRLGHSPLVLILCGTGGAVAASYLAFVFYDLPVRTRLASRPARKPMHAVSQRAPRRTYDQLDWAATRLGRRRLLLANEFRSLMPVRR